MRASMFVLSLALGCTAPDDGGAKDTGDVDTAADTDTDTDTDTVAPGDRDADGFTDDVDCDDTRADVNPGVATDRCNERDDDCDGTIDEDPDLSWYTDADADGFGAAGTEGAVTCAPPGDRYASNRADCDDGDADTWPGADDICDGADNDCDGDADEDTSYWSAFAEDRDSDGAGGTGVVYGCDAASAGGADNTLDCNDVDPLDPVFVSTSFRRGATGTVDDPVGSIQTAILTTTGCVLIEAGDYYEDVSTNGKDVHIEGIDGSDETRIVGGGYAPVLTVTSGETVSVRGLTLTGGGGLQSGSSGSYWDGSKYISYDYYYYYGGGAYLSGSTVSFEDVVFDSNQLPAYSYSWVTDTYYQYYYSEGGAIYAYYADVTLTDVDFLSNNAATGGVFYAAYGTVTGTRVRSLENTADYDLLYLYSTSAKLTNLIVDADRTNGGGYALVAYYADLTVQNATIVDTDYAIAAYSSAVTVDSSAIHGNEVGLYDMSDGSTSWSLTYNNVNGNSTDYSGVDDLTGRLGNIDTSPGFVSFSADGDADYDDLTLTGRSAMVNAGNAGIADPDGSIADIGAYGGPESAGW